MFEVSPERTIEKMLEGSDFTDREKRVLRVVLAVMRGDNADAARQMGYDTKLALGIGGK